VRGPVNLVAPNPVTNGDFARTLGRVLHRPAIFPVPTLIPRLIFGKEMTAETFSASQRVVPAKLAAAAYNFRYPELETALRALLG
jgi:NAD dependent epimerase/dehydratase family enzyme